METLEKIRVEFEPPRQTIYSTAKSRKLRIFYVLLGIGIILLIVGLVSLLVL